VGIICILKNGYNLKFLITSPGCVSSVVACGRTNTIVGMLCTITMVACCRTNTIVGMLCTITMVACCRTNTIVGMLCNITMVACCRTNTIVAILRTNWNVASGCPCSKVNLILIPSDDSLQLCLTDPEIWIF